jgi:7-cyano-7-deazaguanine synthase
MLRIPGVQKYRALEAKEGLEEKIIRMNSTAVSKKSRKAAKSRSSTARAVVLLSGGMDSAVTAAVARKEGYDIYALTVDYGQRHRSEIHAAKKIVKHMKVKKHLVFKADLKQFGASALLGQGKVPKNRNEKEIARAIPPTYVPARNTVFLSLAMAWAEAIRAKAIFIGVNAIDFSGYPDCRPDYINAFKNMARLATRAGRQGRGPKIKTPLLNLTKAQIIKKGRRLGVDFALTQSCYDPGPDGTPCKRCDACLLREMGFREAGIEDPLTRPRKRIEPSI